MRSVAAALAVALLLASPLATAQAPPPRLVVMLVVDQMRADYVDRFARDWTGGLKRLVANGASFKNAAYPYLTTVTCAGHATIATGSFPRTHGVFQNAWWDRERGAPTTCTEDPRASGIGYRAPVKEGDSAWRLQRPTLADMLRAERGARVVTLSLKDRSAIMLAGHGGDAVTWLSDSLDGWVTSNVFSEHALAPVKTFADANPIVVDFGKTWSRSLPAGRYAQPDEGQAEAPPRGWTRTFPHVLNGTTNMPDAAFYGQWERSPYADAYLGRFAAALVDAFALGRHDGKIDLLGVSFSTPDLVGHAFGPRSQEVQDIYLHLDRTIGVLFDHLDAQVGRGQWVVALSADHGVTPIPEQLVGEGRDAGRLSSTAIATIVEDRLRPALGPGKHVAQENGNDVYFAPGVFDKLRASPDLLESVMKAIRDVPGIARVFRGDDLRDPKTAADPLQRAAALSYFPGRSGDLVLVPKPGWMFSTSGTTHGGASPDDQRVPLIFLGPGFRPGTYEDAATPADLVPTLAARLRLSTANFEGHALTPALQP